MMHADASEKDMPTLEPTTAIEQLANEIDLLAPESVGRAATRLLVAVIALGSYAYDADRDVRHMIEPLVPSMRPWPGTPPSETNSSPPRGPISARSNNAKWHPAVGAAWRASPVERTRREVTLVTKKKTYPEKMVCDPRPTGTWHVNVVGVAPRPGGPGRLDWRHEASSMVRDLTAGAPRFRRLPRRHATRCLRTCWPGRDPP